MSEIVKVNPNVAKIKKLTGLEGHALNARIGTSAEHLLCFRIIWLGYMANMSSPGAVYDILVDLGFKITKYLQVKATTVLHDKNRGGKSYQFNFKKGKYDIKKGDDCRYSVNDFDVIALVALLDDQRPLVAYILASELAGPDGKLPTSITLRSRDFKYTYLLKNSRYIEDYMEFPYKVVNGIAEARPTPDNGYVDTDKNRKQRERRANKQTTKSKSRSKSKAAKRTTKPITIPTPVAPVPAEILQVLVQTADQGPVLQY